MTGHDVSPDGPEIIKGHLTQRTAVGVLRLLVQNAVMQIRIVIVSYQFATGTEQHRRDALIKMNTIVNKVGNIKKNEGKNGLSL